MAALSGNYVNFGVFELYGDRALVDALDVTVKMILSIPLADILAFRKVLLSLCAMFLTVLVHIGSAFLLSFFQILLDIPMHLCNLLKTLFSCQTLDVVFQFSQLSTQTSILKHYGNGCTI